MLLVFLEKLSLPLVVLIVLIKFLFLLLKFIFEGDLLVDFGLVLGASQCNLLLVDTLFKHKSFSCLALRGQFLL